MKKKYEISFITNTVLVFAKTEDLAILKAQELQLYNDLPTEVISVCKSTHISDNAFTNY